MSEQSQAKEIGKDKVLITCLQLTLVNINNLDERINVSYEKNDLTKEERDVLYKKRTNLVYQALGQAAILGYEVGIRNDPPSDPQGEWPIICINLPEVGEVAWHCASYKTPYVPYDAQEKTRRINTFCNDALWNTKPMVESSVIYTHHFDLRTQVLLPTGNEDPKK